MISHNPSTVVFYHDTVLFNFLVTLRTPSMGKNFTVNNTSSQEDSRFLSALLLQVECDSYLRRNYHYSTSLTATMTCPYG